MNRSALMPKDPATRDAAHHFVGAFDFGGEGLAVGIKDVIDVAGYQTQAGSRAFCETPVATADAAVVRALRAGDCRIIGKTVMHELAFGVTGINAWAGTPPNPAYPHLVPGGSSSGSATAVAAGVVDVALGTDTGGSIRVPAACCGIVGFKPTFARLSRQGLLPTQSSLDCVGPLARDMAMIERAMAILDPTFCALKPSIRRPRFGLVSAGANAENSAAVLSALEGQDCAVSILGQDAMLAAYQAGMTIMNHEMATAFETLAESGEVGADIAQRLARSARITSAEVAQAEHVRDQFTAQVDAALAHVDVLAMPTLPDGPVALCDAHDVQAALAIAPGPLDLPMVHRTVSPDKLAELKQVIPVGDIGDPHFVGRMVGELASPDAAFVTGTTWDVNGGLFMR